MFLIEKVITIMYNKLAFGYGDNSPQWQRGQRTFNMGETPYMMTPWG